MSHELIRIILHKVPSQLPTGTSTACTKWEGKTGTFLLSSRSRQLTQARCSPHVASITGVDRCLVRPSLGKLVILTEPQLPG